MKKKTLRLIITEDCNFNCAYCCNKLVEVRERFIYKAAGDINVEDYTAVCITGGEPLLNPANVGYWSIVCKDKRVPCYLYTNGYLLSVDIIKRFNGVNIGIHQQFQMFHILDNIPDILKYNVKLYVEDIHRYDYLSNIPNRYIHEWTRDNCFNNADTEDWVVLTDNR
jgi:hypothetical protein